MSVEDKTGTTDDIDWTDEQAVANHMGIDLSGEESSGDDRGAESAKAAEDAKADEDAKAKQAAAEQAAEAKEKAEASGSDDDPAAGSDAVTDGTPEGVYTRDRKHVLDYSVLETARREAAENAARAQELEDQLKDLNAKKDEIRREIPESEQDEALESLEQDYPPELVQLIRSSREDARLARAEVQRLQKQSEDAAARQREVDEQADADSRRVAAMDALAQTPFLERLAKNGGALWDEAKAISARIRSEEQRDRKQAAPMVDHFKTVQAELRETLGLPAEAAPPASEQPKPKQDKPLPDGDLDIPSSLSNIPGGTAPASTEGEAFMDMDSMQSVAHLMDMSPKQMDDFLARNFGG